MNQTKARRSIVLCGFMGCGKSTIGKALARRIGYQFADTDDMLTDKTGQSIAEIFAAHGESGFRDMEHQIIQTAAQLEGFVISTGGGVMTFERNAELLARHALIVHIHRSFDDCYAAVRRRTGRPIAESKSREELLQLYEARLDCYERYAHYTLENHTSISDAVLQISSFLSSSP